VVDFSGVYGGTYFPNAYLGNYGGNGPKAEFSGTLIPADDTYRLGSPISDIGSRPEVKLSHFNWLSWQPSAPDQNITGPPSIAAS
ncbi:MAG: hypothetical protein ACP5U1_11905, partial [Desulfomonilaceae bacterium]